MRALVLAGLGAFALDQGSKALMLHALELPLRGEVAVLPPYLVLRLGWNRGINFGLLSADAEVVRWGLVAVAVAISALVLRWAWGERHRVAVAVSAGLLIGGALGNALDRVVHGAVVDFLNMSCCGIVNPYVFNLADVAIFAGAVGLALVTRSETGGEGRDTAGGAARGRRRAGAGRRAR